MEFFKLGFLAFNLIDLLDILIVAILFFLLYKALKNTIAIQILIGMIIILALQFITEAIHLKSLNWIINTIWDVWLIAFIVLFQPELRKLLLIITKSSVLSFFVKPKLTKYYDEIIESIIELSEKHIGALIVFTKNQNVQMTVDTGIPIEAVVSKELIMSIFNVKSPLHDGAIIVEGDMIVAARCILPLSSMTRYGNKNLGTRHRAALGLSEQSDAIILVVSEETSGISLCQAGEMTLNIKHDELYQILKMRLSDE